MARKLLLLSMISPALVLSTSMQVASASPIDDISQKCSLAEAAQNAGKLDEAKQNLIDALQISWKIPLLTKPTTKSEKAKIATMTQDEKIALANKEYDDSISDVVVISIPMALGQLCDSFEKAGQYDKVVEIHEWLIKNDGLRGGEGSEPDIALNQVLMAKAALQSKNKEKALGYYACAVADETTLKSKMNPGQLQNFSIALKSYSEVLKASGAADDAAKILKKSNEYQALSNPVKVETH